MGEHPIEIAIVGDELRRRLLPHTRHAGEIVRAVASQRGVVDVLLGCDAVSLLHPPGVGDDHVRDATACVEHVDVVIHELERVAIAGHHQHPPVLIGSLARQRGDDVVRLDARHTELGDAERIEHLADQGELCSEEIWRRLTLRLVLRVLLCAERLATDVPGHRHGVGFLIAEQLDEHRREPVDRIRHLPRCRRQVGGERIERPVGEAVSVEERERGHVPERSEPNRQVSGSGC